MFNSLEELSRSNGARREYLGSDVYRAGYWRNVEKIQQYHRVNKQIESSWFNWSSSRIVDYNNYYAYLLKQTNTLKGSGIDGIILNLPFDIVERKDTLWK
jgi:hypothetical protein